MFFIFCDMREKRWGGGAAIFLGFIHRWKLLSEIRQSHARIENLSAGDMMGSTGSRNDLSCNVLIEYSRFGNLVRLGGDGNVDGIMRSLRKGRSGGREFDGR